MNTAIILNELRANRDRIDRAIAALEELSVRPRGQRRRGRRKMSAAARARIAAAQRARWAKWKKGQK